MLWIILFIIVILVSSVLAYRSMKDYEEFPDSLSLNTLFFIGQPQNLDDIVLGKLSKILSSRKQFCSIERLLKGKERVLVIFGPRELARELPELNLVEIEDYLTSDTAFLTENSSKLVDVNQAISWLIEPKNNSKKDSHMTTDFKNFAVKDDQRVFVQIIVMPMEKAGNKPVFQSTIRIMVVDKDSIERVNLSKKVDQVFFQTTGLNKHEDDLSESKKFDSFRERTLIPKEVSEFPLTAQEIISILS